MKGISLWQPWASAIPLGLKGPETRGWPTKYRGDLVIHAARRWTKEQREFASIEHTLGRLPAQLPLGALICIVRLVDVIPTEEAVLNVTAIEKLYGDYTPGRSAWILDDIRPLAEPIPFRGGQGFFNVPNELLGLEPEQVEARLL